MDEASSSLAAAKQIILDLSRSEQDKLAAATTYACSLPPYEQVLFIASMTAMRTLAKQEGYLDGLEQGRLQSTSTIIVNNMTTKINSDNQGSTIAAGDRSAASSNVGQQQGVNVGPGQVTVTRSSLGGGAPADPFDAAAFKEEIAGVMHMMADRIEVLEGAQSTLLTEAMSSLRKVDLVSVATLRDAYQMLEDLWDDSMRNKYRPLRAMFSSNEMDGVGEIAPVLLSLLSKFLGR